MGQQIRLEGFNMWNIIKGFVVALIGGLIVGIIISMSFVVPQPSPEGINIGVLILGILGITLLLIGIFTNITKQSKLKIGTLSRSEFYGVLTVLIAAFFYLSNRIDQIMLLLAQSN